MKSFSVKFFRSFITYFAHTAFPCLLPYFTRVAEDAILIVVSNQWSVVSGKGANSIYFLEIGIRSFFSDFQSHTFIL